MWPHLSLAARGALTGSHTMAARVDILHGGQEVRSLAPLDGSTSHDAGRPVASNLTCSVADPTGELAGSDLGDLMSAYDCELAPYRGVIVSGVTEWVPLGVYRITGRTIGVGQVGVSAQDRAVIYQGPMTGALAIGPGTAVEMAIIRLLVTRYSGVTMVTHLSGRTVGPLLYAADIDVWAEAQSLAASIGCWLHHDRLGALVLSPALPTVGQPVARYAYGDGITLSIEPVEDADTVHNAVVVESVKTGSGGGIRAIAEDLDPASPTYVNGRYGRHPITLPNQHVGSLTQAGQMAATELARELGRSQTFRVTAVPDPTRDPLDVITMDYPTLALHERPAVCQTVTIPLTATDPMNIETRQSLIAANGRVISVATEVTTS